MFITHWIQQLRIWFSGEDIKVVRASVDRQEVIRHLVQAYLHERLSARLCRQLAEWTVEKSRRADFYRLAHSHELTAAQRGIALVSLGISVNKIHETWFDHIWCWILVRLGTEYTLHWIRNTESDDLTAFTYVLTHEGIERTFPGLPTARLEDVNRLLMTLAAHNRQIPLAQLAREISLGVDTLPAVLAAAELLQFVHISRFSVSLTALGKQTAALSFLERKQVFRQQVLHCIPLMNVILSILRESSAGALNGSVIREVLSHHWKPREAERQFGTVVDWGCYAHLFEYDKDEDRLALIASNE